ncbi:unnamed protein product [Malus baccata var. baccata]
MSNCLSLFDAETFSKRLDLELPGHDFGFVVHGSWNGLVCISNSAFMTLESPVYLWNPSIRNLKRLPNSLQHTTAFVHLGFGFHSEVDNYRVVRVARFLCNKSIFGIEVYNFRLNCWRTITTVPPVSNDVNFLQSACVFLNGVVYWITKEPSQHSPSILTFDLGSEVFQKILLPETTVEVPTDVGIQVVENSVSLFQVRTDRLGLYCDISVLEENTWKMMQTIIFPYSKLAWPLGMEADGRLHLAIKGDNPDHPELVLFDPKSIEIRVTGIGLNCKYLILTLVPSHNMYACICLVDYLERFISKILIRFGVV